MVVGGVGEYSVENVERSSSIMTIQKSLATADLDKAERDTALIQKSGENHLKPKPSPKKHANKAKPSRQYDPKFTKTLEAQISDTMQKTSAPTDFQKVEQLDVLEEQRILDSYEE